MAISAHVPTCSPTMLVQQRRLPSCSWCFRSGQCVLWTALGEAPELDAYINIGHHSNSSSLYIIPLHLPRSFSAKCHRHDNVSPSWRGLARFCGNLLQFAATWSEMQCSTNFTQRLDLGFVRLNVYWFTPKLMLRLLDLAHYLIWSSKQHTQTFEHVVTHFLASVRVLCACAAHVPLLIERFP